MSAVASPSPLTPAQQALVSEMIEALAALNGVEAIALGGSYATGFATDGSDIDLGLLYSDAAPFAIAEIRALAARFNDEPDPVVTNFYEWGRWVNGGAWLTVGGQRVDWLYRSTEHVERVIADAEAGRFEVDSEQMPPFGFFGPTYLGELRACIPLHDPSGRLEQLRKRVSEYPDALRNAVVESQLWAVEFALSSFAAKFCAREQVWLTASTLARCIHQMATALFALNRVYPVNDKTTLLEISRFDRAPSEFGQRAESTLAALGDGRDALETSVRNVRDLFDETVALAGDLYQTRRLP
jgi:predicted nucleotidyltransferase